MPSFYLDHLGACNLTDLSIVIFNNNVESMLREELFKFLEQCEVNFENTKDYYTFKTSPFTRKAAIFQFLKKYNIDPRELSYQTLNKDYYRYKKKKQKKTPSGVSSNKLAKKISFGSIKLSA